jgi:hypothetical protein
MHAAAVDTWLALSGGTTVLSPVRSTPSRVAMVASWGELDDAGR